LDILDIVDIVDLGYDWIISIFLDVDGYTGYAGYVGYRISRKYDLDLLDIVDIGDIGDIQISRKYDLDLLDIGDIGIFGYPKNMIWIYWILWILGILIFSKKIYELFNLRMYVVMFELITCFESLSRCFNAPNTRKSNNRIIVFLVF